MIDRLRRDQRVADEAQQIVLNLAGLGAGGAAGVDVGVLAQQVLHLGVNLLQRAAVALDDDLEVARNAGDGARLVRGVIGDGDAAVRRAAHRRVAGGLHRAEQAGDLQVIFVRDQEVLLVGAGRRRAGVGQHRGFELLAVLAAEGLGVGALVEVAVRGVAEDLDADVELVGEGEVDRRIGRAQVVVRLHRGGRGDRAEADEAGVLLQLDASRRLLRPAAVAQHVAGGVASRCR